jgi:hypothetical protein
MRAFAISLFNNEGWGRVKSVLTFDELENVATFVIQDGRSADNGMRGRRRVLTLDLIATLSRSCL